MGAVGDIGVNVSQHIDPHSSLGQVVNSYNLAMGVIGIKNLGQAGYKFAKNLPQATKELLQKNGNLRSLLVEKYLSYRIAITKLKNSDEWVKLSSDVRKEIVQQEKVFIELTDAKNIANDQWGIKGVFINGKTSEDILSIPKGQRPDPSTYLSSGYIQQHLTKFEKEGGAFIIRRRDVVESNYITMAPRKFIGLRSDMEGVIRKYNDSNKNLNVLIEELDLGKDYFKATDEVFFVKVPPEKFTFDFPNGNEVGAYDELWIPGGYTIHGTKEAVISNSENLIHNKDWDTFINFFGSNNVLKIK